MSSQHHAQVNGTCGDSEKQWYYCSTDLQGCCSVNPCELLMCPDGVSSLKEFSESMNDDDTPTSKASDSEVPIIVGAVTCAVIALVVVGLLLFFYTWRRRKQQDDRLVVSQAGKEFDETRSTPEKGFDVDRSAANSSLLDHHSFVTFEGFDGRYSSSPDYTDVHLDDFPIADMEKAAEPPLYTHPAYRSTHGFDTPPFIAHPGTQVSIPHMPSPSPVRHQTTSHVSSLSSTGDHQIHFARHAFCRDEDQANRDSESYVTASSSPSFRNNSYSQRSGLSKIKLQTASLRPKSLRQTHSYEEQDQNHTFFEERSPTPFP